MMEKSPIQIYYGEGRGKTNAALGSALCAAAAGKTVFIVQFMKGKGGASGELVQRLEPDIKIFRFEKSDEYYEALSDDEKNEEKMNMRNGLNFAKKVLVTGECNLLILDEVLGLVDNGVITSEELETLLQAKTDETEIIMTGRVLGEPMRAYADEIYHIEAEKPGSC